MSWRGIKRDKADSTFSLYIRLRDGKCKKCWKLGQPDKDGRLIKGLDNSHFWSRGRENTRFDPENCDTFCRYCHDYFGSNPGEYAEWKRKQLGDLAYDQLMVRANLYAKKDRIAAYIYSKALLDDFLRQT